MTPGQETGLFQGLVAHYERYRLTYPQRLIQRVAGLLGLKPGDAVLDLGCGTGMLATGFAGLGMAVTAMDPEPEMLAATGAAARAQGVAVTAIPGGSQDLTPAMGPFRLVAMVCHASYPLNSENASPPGTFTVYLSGAARISPARTGRNITPINLFFFILFPSL